MNAETGELIRVFDFPISGTAVWTMDSKALIYSQRHNANLWRIAIEGDAKPQQLSNFESGEIKTFAVSLRLQTIRHLTGTVTYEVVLLEKVLSWIIDARNQDESRTLYGRWTLATDRGRVCNCESLRLCTRGSMNKEPASPVRQHGRFVCQDSS